MRKLFLSLALALFASSAFAQGAAKDGSLALLYDVDSTSLTYCTLQGQGGGPFAPPISVQKAVTAAASTTLAETVVGSNPFVGIVVGDVLVIQTSAGGSPTLVAITAKASDASVTVDSAITVTGAYFSYYHHVCGTSDSDGWFAPGNGAQSLTLTAQYDQGDLGGFVVRFERKATGPGGAPIVLYPGGGATCGGLGYTLSTDRCSATTPGVLARLDVVDAAPTGLYRVGFAYVTSDASDATTNREKVTIKVAVR